MLLLRLARGPDAGVHCTAADPNVYPSGKVCLVRFGSSSPRSVRSPAISRARANSTATTRPKQTQSILNDEKGWKPSVTIKQILVGVQDLLDTPNAQDAAQEPAWRLFHQSQAKYIERVKQEVRPALTGCRHDGERHAGAVCAHFVCVPVRVAQR